MNKKLYIVQTSQGFWRGSYDASLNFPNQPSAEAQAIINAKSHGGVVFLVEGENSTQVYPK